MNNRYTGKHARSLAVAWLLAALAGCASAPAVPTAPAVTPANAEAAGFFGGLADKAMSALGFQKPAAPEIPEMPNVPDSALPDRRIAWKVFASDSLNTTPDGKSLGLVVRMFKLKSPDTFLQAPYEVFGDTSKEHEALADDLIASRELLLKPGQRYQATDKVVREARFVGIVAMYRNPLQGRWRYVFNANAAEKTGLHLGAHACAMSVQVGEAIGMTPKAARTLDLPCP
jgi:type VI secretion system protein VasD